MSTACTCPEDRRTIRRADRVYVLGPLAEQRNGTKVSINMDHIHIYHKDCPKHGYKVIEENDR